MTLCQAITAVPELASSCSLVLMQGQLPGSGIKLMRLVCKQLRIAMLGAVQGYTLNLNGSGAALLNEMTVLHGTRLSCLRVVVTNNINGGCLAGLNGWDAHSLHLRCFISGMGHAIRDLVRLEVDVKYTVGSSAVDVATLLSQLAPACPALLQLQVTGAVGRGLLAALGASCRNLSCLEMMDEVPIKALQQLHLSLPGLTHVKVAAADRIGKSIPRARPYCLAVQSCASLTSLDIGTSTLTLPMWQTLPATVKELHCSLTPEPLDGLTLLASLEHLYCMCNPHGNHTSLRSLAAVLRVAPKLTRVFVSGHGTDSARSSLLSELYLPCASYSIPDLVYLHDRVSTGLTVTSTLCEGGGYFPGVNLSLSLYATAEGGLDEYDDILGYMGSLPPLPAFPGLILASTFKLPSFAPVAKAIAAVFPNLTALAMDLRYSIRSTDVQHLGSFTALQYLSFERAQVNSASLALLCTRMPLLKLLRLGQCDGISVDEGCVLQIALSEWGSTSKVVILPAP